MLYSRQTTDKAVQSGQKKSPSGLKIYILIFRFYNNKNGGIGTDALLRRLPGVIGPCPSTTLDKSSIYFLKIIAPRRAIVNSNFRQQRKAVGLWL